MRAGVASVERLRFVVVLVRRFLGGVVLGWFCVTMDVSGCGLWLFGVAVVCLAGCGFGGWRGTVFWGMVGVFLVVMWFSGVGVFVLYASGFGFEGGWCFGVYLWVLGVLAGLGAF